MSLAKSGGAEVLIEGSLNVSGGRELHTILTMTRDCTTPLTTRTMPGA